jgi:hypothetical protein
MKFEIGKFLKIRVTKEILVEIGTTVRILYMDTCNKYIH